MGRTYSKQNLQSPCVTLNESNQSGKDVCYILYLEQNCGDMSETSVCQGLGVGVATH